MMTLSKRRWTPIGWLVGVAAVPLWSLSGCGGSGNGVVIPPPVVLGTPTPGPTPTPTPTPNPNATPAPTPFPTGTTFTPNYITNLDGPTRWASFPISVYFVPNSNLTAARQAIATTGFNQWVTMTQGRVRYNIVNTSAQADRGIKVTFSAVTNPSAGDELGVSNVFFDGNTFLIDHVDMNIGITGDNREDIQTAAHEYGHSIGITGSGPTQANPTAPDRAHSPNPADLMFPVGNSAGCSCITPSDLNTIYTIYRGQFNTNANARSNGIPGPLRSYTIH